MAQKQTREQLGVKTGDKIVIKGKVTFAKLDKLVDGDALVAENKRREQNGMIVADKPFRSVSIEEPVIVSGQGSPLAQFHGQTVYQAASGKQTMTIESKSNYAPSYGHMQNGQIIPIPDPQKNPAPGQEIYILIEAFGSKGFNRLGSSFNSIVFSEGEIKFYEGGAGNNLAGFGQILNMPVGEMAPQAPVQANLFGQPPANIQTPVAVAQTNGFGQAPVQENGFGQQTQPAVDQFSAFGQQPTPQPELVRAGAASNPFA